MNYAGDFTPGKTVVVRFNSRQADGTPITLAGSPAVSAYKNSTTESTSGITLTVDYDSRTGLHSVVVDTSANGTFYAAANDFDLVLTAGTVDGVSVVGVVVGSFSLSNRSALRPATADRTLVVDAAGLADANVVKWAGTAVVGATDGTPMVTVDQFQDHDGLVAEVMVPGSISLVTGAVKFGTLGLDTAGTTTLLARLGAPAGASVSADLAAVAAKTVNLPASPAAVGSAMTLADGAIAAAKFAASSITSTACPALAFLDVAVGTRMATYVQPTGFLAAAFPASPAAVGSAMTLTSGERDSVAAALLDLVNAIETNVTLRQALRALLATDAGVVTGAGTGTETFKNPAGTAPRVVVTVDGSGNRSSITLS